VRVRRVIYVVALAVYLVPLVLGILLALFRDVPALARLYARYHYLTDLLLVALSAAATGAVAFLLMKRLLGPWERLEEELGHLIQGRGRLLPVGEEHADRVVEKINTLLALQEDFQRLEDLQKNALAQNLHDGAVQSLIAARWALGAGDRSAAERSLDEAEKALRSAIEALMPPELEHLPLADALRAYGARRGVQVEVAGQAPEDPEARAEVFRVAREAIENARRHGGARRVRIRLLSGPEVGLEVLDDGAGPEGEGRPGHGLDILRARMRLLGGRLEFGPAPEGGARLLAVWPRGGKDADFGDRRPRARA